MKIKAIHRLRLLAQAFRRKDVEPRISALRLHLSKHLMAIYLFDGRPPTNHWWEEIESTYETQADLGNLKIGKRLAARWYYEWLYTEYMTKLQLKRIMDSVQRKYAPWKPSRPLDIEFVEPLFKDVYRELSKHLSENEDWLFVQRNIQNRFDSTPKL
jgi:hypothetical protein